MKNKMLYPEMFLVSFFMLMGASISGFGARQAPAEVSIGKDDIGGTVVSPGGPEAGVWVIAETTDLPTRYIKIVVTDDRGRYLVPALPKAKYNVWVRGYGLVDSQKVRTSPGKILNLAAVVAPNPHAAAQYYPAVYWYSLLEMPAGEKDRPRLKTDLSQTSDRR